MKWLKVQCPACGEEHAHHRLGPVMYSPVVLVLIGGVVLPLIFELSRKPRFRCEKCESVFTKHTVASRLFQVLWLWVVLGLLIAMGGLIASSSGR
jgi:transposase-like protein